ncbi:MAG: hypothetical protein DI586_06230 [Micavibrio aeruginosavorus]|uniref:Aminoacetone oxidase family FAD-binding enzyme n=1 Tax=Micavibrio aeruginosavorus TaxID=349221 RepID=A0A2W5HPA2_9BACT|nr:MAG: hypothetical protein DI586_06230 [Micavibrio aeruginosavorus]
MFINASGEAEILASDITLLALGGASWPNLGSDGTWVSILKNEGIEVNTLRPANCGFNVEWSDIFRSKFSGQPLKNISLTFENRITHGEVMISSQGIEGGAVYALSSLLRQSLDNGQETILKIDLKPSLTSGDISNRLDQTSRKKNSFSAYLQKTLGLNPVSIGLLREASLNVQNFANEDLAKLIKALPLKITSPFDIEKAISSAGGITLSSVDKNMMLKKIPGIFVAGEMLDWEAPTGGYLLQACFSTGVAAARGILNYTKSD